MLNDTSLKFQKEIINATWTTDWREVYETEKWRPLNISLGCQSNTETSRVRKVQAHIML